MFFVSVYFFIDLVVRFFVASSRGEELGETAKPNPGRPPGMAAVAKQLADLGTPLCNAGGYCSNESRGRIIPGMFHTLLKLLLIHTHTHIYIYFFFLRKLIKFGSM